MTPAQAEASALAHLTHLLGLEGVPTDSAGLLNQGCFDCEWLIQHGYGRHGDRPRRVPQ